MHKHRAPPACLALATLLSACVDEASVGDQQQCLGPRTRCVAPEEQYLNAPRTISTLPTAALVALDPVWSRPIALPLRPHVSTRASELGALMGGGPGSMKVVRASDDRKSVEAFTLNPEGEITSSRAVAAPEATVELAVASNQSVPYAGPKESVVALALSPASQTAPGPMVGVVWGQPCKDEAGEYNEFCSVNELLVFDADEGSAPHRYDADTLSGAHARAQDGGRWSFKKLLRRFDEAGELLLQQNVAYDSDIYLGTTAVESSPALVEPIAASASGKLMVGSYVDFHASPFSTSQAHLWRFDSNGNPEYHASLQGGTPKSMTSVIDSRGRWNLIMSGDRGDLELVRVDTENNVLTDAVQVLRESYGTLWVYSVATDAADNIYVLTQTGLRDEEVPTLCRRPLDGEVACYLVPGLTSENIVGGEAGVVYAAVSKVDRRLLRGKLIESPAAAPDGPPTKPDGEPVGPDEPAPTATELILQRYEWPEP